ncbi:GNAT family N-acetyltransferase [Haloarchaeobius sp. DFWS5]|uniref:GNAT family N-acetyltransferase n=1 Tax=Haloarchaeobius sp. DFWS5 TaxID=3446114 RepID=UPI003EB8A60B
MQFCTLPAEESAVRRYVEELWLPYNRTLETAVASHALVDWSDDDIVEAEIDFRLGKLEAEGYELVVAVDDDADPADDDVALADTPGDFTGFIATELNPAPPIFDQPDRLKIGDIFVREPYRGSGLASDLVDRVVERARDENYPELALDVDVDNERALAFYDRIGFEPHRHTLTASVDGLTR